MIPVEAVVISAVVLVLLWLVGTYNGLVRTRNHCSEAWSGIDTELKRRHDLIPNLVATVQGYATHERTLFDSVLAARARALSAEGSPAALGREEAAVVRGLNRVFAVAEAYPDLKASANFLALQQELVDTEDRIQAARRFYNGNVRDLNNRCETFPSKLLASAFGFSKREPFELEVSLERESPTVGS